MAELTEQNFYFTNFPTVDYDIKKNGKSINVPNLTVRYKIMEVLKSQSAAYFDYSIHDGVRADMIADQYYGDSSLDWIVYLTNNITDPQWEWPLPQEIFDDYIRSKYGSVEIAQATIHHYEFIVQRQTVDFEGNIVPENRVTVDLDTYNTTPSDQRGIKYNYDYEIDVNESKRNIRLLDERVVMQVVDRAQEIFE